MSFDRLAYRNRHRITVQKKPATKPASRKNERLTFLSLFESEETIKGHAATNGIMNMLASMPFSVAKWLLVVFGLLLIINGVALFCQQPAQIALGISFIIIGVVFAISALIFRRASLEMENSTDTQFITNIFATMMSFTAVIVSVLTLAVTIMK